MDSLCASCGKTHTPALASGWRCPEIGKLVCPRCWPTWATDRAPESRKSVMRADLEDLFPNHELENSK